MDDEIDLYKIYSGKSDEELAVMNTKLAFRHFYMIFDTFQDKAEFNDAINLYWETWRPLMEQSIKDTAKRMGVDKIKDFPTLAEVFKNFYLGFPLISEIKEADDRRAVIEVIFCPNPVYGSNKFDSYLDRARYQLVEGLVLTKRLVNLFVELLMPDKAKFIVTSLNPTMCLGADRCRIAIELMYG